jgi:hypothetical protein
MAFFYSSEFDNECPHAPLFPYAPLLIGVETLLLLTDAECSEFFTKNDAEKFFEDCLFHQASAVDSITFLRYR